MSALALLFLSLFLLASLSVLISLPLERLDWWLKFTSAVLAGLTVMIGVWAFFTGEKISDIQKERIATVQLEAAKANEGLANTTVEIEQAKADAAKANERSQTLESLNLQLRTDLENATAESHAKQTELTREQQVLTEEQRRTAESQEKAATSIREALWNLSQVRSLQTPRRLVKGQNREEFIEGLKVRGNPKGIVEIIWAGDMFIGEPETFAIDIAGALKEGGWTVSKMQGVLLSASTDEAKDIANINKAMGLKIVVRDPENPSPSASALHWAFLKGGFVSDFIPAVGKLEGDIVRLLVWPIPPEGGWVLRFREK